MFAQSSTASFYGPFMACVVTLILTTTLHITSTIYTAGLLKQLLPATKEYSYVGEDFPSQLPLDVPTVGLPLESNTDRYTLLADDEWGTLFPSNGFTDLGPDNRTFHVSMIHQLHCLDIIRVGFVVNGTHAAQHVDHCLRYLRQIILCHADTTLEVDSPVIRNGGIVHAASGVGMVHRCNDWTTVRRYLRDHPATN